jgi:DNA-binding beta-propeller fold protein YncE
MEPDRMLRTLAVLLAAVLLAACGDPLVPHVPLTSLANIQLPKDTTLPSFDLLTLDARVGRLYVAHSSNNAVDVVDLKNNRVLGTITGLFKVHAIALSSDPNIIFTSDPGNASVGVVDVSTLKLIKSIDTGPQPDAIGYDPADDLVVAVLASSNTVKLIDPHTYKVVATIALPGSPELMDVDPQQGTIYVAINDKAEVVAIDGKAHQITATFKGCDIEIPTGVVYAADQQRLYVASRPGNNRELNVIDTLLDKCLGVVDIGFGTDQIAYNSHLHHVYAANGGSKNLSVIDTVNLKPLGVVGTGPIAKSVAVDPTTDRVYVLVGRAGIIGVYHDP